MTAAQITLAGQESRLLLAFCIAQSGVLKPYLEHGRILMKGGATVSLLARQIAGTPLRLSGCMSAAGMRGALRKGPGAHFLLLESGRAQNVDEDPAAAARMLGPGDLFLTGANAIDAYGNAALLIGSPGGGGYGACMGALYTEGFRTLILTSVQKLIPGDLRELYGRVDRNRCAFSYGMACALAPIPGEIITETEALSLFAGVRAVCFARGGHTGAEDAAAFQITGETAAVEKVLELTDRIKSIPPITAAEAESETECTFPCAGCKTHRACRYAGKQTIWKGGDR